MSYSNKQFNVNGIGDADLLSVLQLASKNALICGYTINNEEGLRIFFSHSLLPESAIINENPKSVEDEFKVITIYLEKLRNSIVYDGLDQIDDEMVGKDGVDYALGWRVYVELYQKDNMRWWNHCIIVRPSYVIK